MPFGELKTVDATVLECTPKRAHIVVAPLECDTNSGCKGCTSCADRPGARSMWLPVQYGGSVTPGSKVRFTRFVVNEALAALLVFGLPILAAASTLIIWAVVAPNHVESPTAIGSALLAFAGGFGFSWALEKILLRIHPPRLDPIPQKADTDR